MYNVSQVQIIIELCVSTKHFIQVILAHHSLSPLNFWQVNALQAIQASETGFLPTSVQFDIKDASDVQPSVRYHSDPFKIIVITMYCMSQIRVCIDNHCVAANVLAA